MLLRCALACPTAYLIKQFFRSFVLKIQHEIDLFDFGETLLRAVC